MPQRKRPYFLGVWLSQEAGDWINQQAKEPRKRSDLIRAMLAYARTHMPKGWRP